MAMQGTCSRVAPSLVRVGLPATNAELCPCLSLRESTVRITSSPSIMPCTIASFTVKLALVVLCAVAALECTQASEDAPVTVVTTEASLSPTTVTSSGQVQVGSETRLSGPVTKCICRCRNLAMVPEDVPNCAACSRAFCVNTWARCAEVAVGGTVIVGAAGAACWSSRVVGAFSNALRVTGSMLGVANRVYCHSRAGRLGRGGHCGRGAALAALP